MKALYFENPAAAICAALAFNGIAHAPAFAAEQYARAFSWPEEVQASVEARDWTFSEMAEAILTEADLETFIAVVEAETKVRNTVYRGSKAVEVVYNHGGFYLRDLYAQEAESESRRALNGLWVKNASGQKVLNGAASQFFTVGPLDFSAANGTTSALEAAASQHGWSHEQQISILLEYIDNLHADKAFLDHLDMAAQ